MKKALFIVCAALLLVIGQIPAIILWTQPEPTIKAKCVYEWKEHRYTKHGYGDVIEKAVVLDERENTYVLNTTCREFNQTNLVPWETEHRNLAMLGTLVELVDFSLIGIFCLFAIAVVVCLMARFYCWAFIKKKNQA